MKRLLLTLVFAAIVAAAFMWGRYLMGTTVGIWFTILAAAPLVLIIRSVSATGRYRWVKRLLACLLGLSILVFLFTPQTFMPDLEYHIEQQSMERQIQREITAVFQQSAAYTGLDVDIWHRKGTVVTLRGELANHAVFIELRQAILAQCPERDSVRLRWDLTLSEPRQKIRDFDKNLFPPVRDADAPDAND